MSSSLHRVAIVGAARTPIGRFGGSLRDVPAVALGRLSVTASLERAGVPPSEVPELIFGHCIQAGAGQNPARQVLRAAGIPDSAGGVTVNKVCGSGMKSIFFGVAEILTGEFPLVVAGGMESMSGGPFLLPAMLREGHRLGAFPVDDAMLRDSLLDAYGEHEHMGATGERVARVFDLTREDVDRFALRSHLLASSARDGGIFDAEIVPVPPGITPGGPGLARDEGPRSDTTPEGLARLRPAFSANGILTAGNSSQISDGGAAVVLASQAEVSRRGLKPLAWFHSGEVNGVPPPRVMESPIPTVRAHLKRVGLAPSDFDRVEHNEAFASASVAVQRSFGFTEEQFNVHGGAVALGHPIGASGARIVVTLLYEMIRSRARLGLATLCMGGGNGLSAILDRRDIS